MLITAEEVSVQTGVQYEGAELDRVNAIITDVSAAIEAFCRRTFTEPVPQAVKAVCMIEVRRLLNSEPGVASERVADLTTGYAYGGGSVLLSNSAKQDLLAYLRWSRPAVGSIRLFSPLYVSTLCPPTIEAPASASGDFRVQGRTQSESLVQVQYSTDGVAWDDYLITSSYDISDGGYPFWSVDFLAPVESGIYRFRARCRVDEETSGWSGGVSTEFTAV